MTKPNERINRMSDKISRRLGFKPVGCHVCIHAIRCQELIIANAPVVCELSDEDAEVPLVNRASKHATGEDDDNWQEYEHTLHLQLKNNLW
jgi:hypothetical protein